ncbi:conserved hypothetical protein [Vibrio phage 150E35-1]|nr:conserved hypothetical protein [Vibrio phage 150E35-1]
MLDRPESGVQLPAQDMQLSPVGVIIPPQYMEITKMLPSGCKSYPEGTQIYVRPYNAGEIFHTSDQQERGKGGMANYERVLSGIKFKSRGQLQDPGYITLPDFLFICLYRKVITLGTKHFTVGGYYRGKPVQKNLSIEKLVFTDMKAEKVPVNVPLGESRTPVAFRPISVKTYLDFWKSQDRVPNAIDQLVLGSNVVDESLIREAVGKDVDNLRKVDEYLAHGIEPVEVQLEGGGSIMLDLQDPSNIVLPFRGSDDDPEDEITFG